MCTHTATLSVQNQLLSDLQGKDLLMGTRHSARGGFVVRHLRPHDNLKSLTAMAVHAGLRTLRAQALRNGAGIHGQGLATFTKDNPINNKSLFEDCLGTAVVKAASTFSDFKALWDCFVLSGLSRSEPPKSRKQKASTSLPFHGRSQSGNWQGRSSHSIRSRSKRKRKSKGKGINSQVGKPHTVAVATAKIGHEA